MHAQSLIHALFLAYKEYVGGHYSNEEVIQHAENWDVLKDSKWREFDNVFQNYTFYKPFIRDDDSLSSEVDHVDGL